MTDTELLEAAETIKARCLTTTCYDCLYYLKHLDECCLMNDAPYEWKIENIKNNIKEENKEVRL